MIHSFFNKWCPHHMIIKNDMTPLSIYNIFSVYLEQIHEAFQHGFVISNFTCKSFELLLNRHLSSIIVKDKFNNNILFNYNVN